MDIVFRSALAFLTRDQCPSGRLRSRVYSDPELGGPSAEDETPFVTAFAVPALETIPDGTGEVRERALAYLIATAEPPGVWRYWSTGHTVLDPDLDDTACASLALRDRHLSVLCGANRPLILANRDDRGRFRTWLRPGDADSEGRGNDVDSVVNANVVTYLGDGPGTAGAVAWLVELVKQGRVDGSSSYYPLTLVSLAYCIGRALSFGVGSLQSASPALTVALAGRRRPDGSFGSALETALTVTALIRFGHRDRKLLEPACDALRRQQRADGSWPPAAFYCGPEPPAPRSVWFGSEALTTVLCLEALELSRPGRG